MAVVSGFRRLADPGGSVVRFRLDDAEVTAHPGESVAAALMAAGHFVLRRTPVSGAPRGPFCMMGACFECLVEIDGEANRQACMTTVAEGMRVRRMSGARETG